MADTDESSVLDVLASYEYDGLTPTYEVANITPSKIIEEGLSRYLLGSDFKDLFMGKQRIVFIVNDRNRPTPTHIVLEHVQERYPSILERTYKVVVATGTHKEPTHEDIRTILGRTYDALKDRVHIHRSREEAEHIPYGITSRGTPLLFDRTLENADMLVLINSVEPHYFAGFTGGRKSIIPGIAAYRTIEANDSMALDPGSGTLALEGNPVHEDMMEACRTYLDGKEHISFQIVQAPGVEITHMEVGDVFSSFNKAVEVAKRRFCTPIRQKYDIVVAMARPPMDRTLYQAQKAIEHGKLAMKEGGTLVLVAGCREGIGQTTFWDLLTSSRNQQEVLDAIERTYKLGYHKAARIARLSMKSDIFMVSEIAPGELEKGFIKGFNDLGSAMKEALRKHEGKASILLIPDGCVTVPFIE